MKKSKEGVVIGETVNGNDITVHELKHDVNGNWCYLVDYYPRKRKIAIQHGAACGHLNLISDLTYFENENASAKEVAKEVVDYINKYTIK